MGQAITEWHTRAQEIKRGKIAQANDDSAWEELVRIQRSSTVNIIDFDPDNEIAIQQAANLLVEGFKVHWPDAWPDMESALREVRDALQPSKINRIAVDDEGTVMGWVGALSEYNGHAWELHPLVVRPDQQGQRIGSALVADLEAQVRARGGITIYLGTDDEDSMTSLANTEGAFHAAGEFCKRVQVSKKC